VARTADRPPNTRTASRPVTHTSRTPGDSGEALALEETVAIPDDVPELGVEAGATGTIVTVYESGRSLLVEIGREDGTSVGLVELEVGEDGSLRPTSSTPFSSR